MMTMRRRPMSTVPVIQDPSLNPGVTQAPPRATRRSRQQIWQLAFRSPCAGSACGRTLHFGLLFSLRQRVWLDECAALWIQQHSSRQQSKAMHRSGLIGEPDRVAATTFSHTIR